MPMPPIASIHDPLRRNDCGNWEPRPNYHNGEQFCANCSGWRRYHEPFFSAEQASVIHNMEQIVTNARLSALPGFAGQEHLTNWVAQIAGQARWSVHRHGSHESAHDLRYKPHAVNVSCLFPDLLLVGTDRLEPAVIEPYGDNWGGARPGGFLGVWVRTQHFPELHARTASWRDSFAGAGGETLLVTPESLASAVLRITGRELDV